MNSLLNALLVIVLALNLLALGTSRIITVIKVVSLQGILLGIIPLVMEDHLALAAVFAAAAAIILKGLVIPSMMMRAMRDVQIKREMEPLIGFLPSMLLGALHPPYRWPANTPRRCWFRRRSPRSSPASFF
jgi:hydrogenase-4 component E